MEIISLVRSTSLASSFSFGKTNLYSDARTLFGDHTKAYFATVLSFSAQSMRFYEYLLIFLAKIIATRNIGKTI